MKVVSVAIGKRDQALRVFAVCLHEMRLPPDVVDLSAPEILKRFYYRQGIRPKDVTATIQGETPAKALQALGRAFVDEDNAALDLPVVGDR